MKLIFYSLKGVYYAMQNIKDCTILIIDDELPLLDMVKQILTGEGYHSIFTASSCKEGRTLFEELKPHLVILDVNLPDGDGFSLIQQLHLISMTPVLFLSARDEDDSRLLGLGLGADDYMTKPFLPRELILRLGIILRRTYYQAPVETSEKPILHLGEVVIDLNSGNVTRPDGLFTLTAKEYALLEKLYINRNHIVTIDALCEAAWNDAVFGYENSLMVHIRRLRAKIELNPSKPQFLLTVRGLGYKLVLEA